MYSGLYLMQSAIGLVSFCRKLFKFFMSMSSSLNSSLILTVTSLLTQTIITMLFHTENSFTQVLIHQESCSTKFQNLQKYWQPGAALLGEISFYFLLILWKHKIVQNWWQHILLWYIIHLSTQLSVCVIIDKNSDAL